MFGSQQGVSHPSPGYLKARSAHNCCVSCKSHKHLQVFPEGSSCIKRPFTRNLKEMRPRRFQDQISLRKKGIEDAKEKRKMAWNKSHVVCKCPNKTHDNSFISIPLSALVGKKHDYCPVTVSA